MTFVPLAACGQLIGTLELEVLTPEPNPSVTTSDPGTGGSPSERGTVNGAICFPSEFIPEMSVYFQNIETGEFRELAIAQNQSTFLAELPPGTYIAFAYPESLPFRPPALCRAGYDNPHIANTETAGNRTVDP